MAATKKNVADLQVTSLHVSHRLVTIFALCQGEKYEFASHCGGSMEVYDYPKSWHGLARFVGHMPVESEVKLRELVAQKLTRVSHANPVFETAFDVNYVNAGHRLPWADLDARDQNRAVCLVRKAREEKRQAV